MTLADGYQLNASGTRQNFNAYNGAMPAFTFRAFGGANAKLALPHPTLMATGVGVVVGRAALDMPTPMLAAAGFGGSVGEASLILTGGYTVRAFSGAVVAVTLQDGYTLHASGTAGSVGGAALTMPLFELTAAGSVNGLSSAVLTMPMLRPVPSGVARLTLPYGFALFAAGSATVAVTYEAYAVNLLTALDRNPQNQYDPDVREVTHYTNFPFNQIVRFNNHYYGVADDGLYLLEGDTDNGTAIPWKFRTTLTDAGSKQKKRIKSLYFGARLHSQVTVTLVVGEKQDQEYSYTTPRDATAQSYRQKFGKGIKTRYFAIEVGDTAGNFAEFDALDTEREILERTL
jgi:hypothetical protein